MKTPTRVLQQLRRGRPRVRPLLQRLPHEVRPQRRVARREGDLVAGEDHVDGVRLVVHLEGRLAHQQLEGQDARRPHVDLRGIVRDGRSCDCMCAAEAEGRHPSNGGLPTSSSRLGCLPPTHRSAGHQHAISIATGLAQNDTALLQNHFVLLDSMWPAPNEPESQANAHTQAVEARRFGRLHYSAEVFASHTTSSPMRAFSSYGRMPCSRSASREMDGPSCSSALGLASTSGAM